MKKFLFLLIPFLVLSGCHGSHQRVNDGEILEKGTGLLLAKVINKTYSSLGIDLVDYDQNYSPFSHKETFFYKYSVKNILRSPKSSDERYLLVKMPEGKYMLGKVYLHGVGQSRFKGTYFKIEPGRINYVGDITIQVRMENQYPKTSIHIDINEGKAKGALKKDYPNFNELLLFKTNRINFLK